MSKLDRKLRELKNKRARREFIAELTSKLASLLERKEFSHDTNSLRFAAFSTWDMERDTQTTTRGDIFSWEINYSKDFASLISKAKEIELSIVPGWFFIETDGPYYSFTLAEFILNLDGLSNFCLANEKFDIGWVGRETDMGIIFEFNHTSFCRNEFEFYTWGI